MAVAIRTTNFISGVGPSTYDRVMAAVDLVNDPPEGLIAHWAGDFDRRWTVIEVWESRDDHDRFRKERLMPAIRKVTGFDPAFGPQPTVTEHPVHHYVIP
jgi:hypothetical protein